MAAPVYFAAVSRVVGAVLWIFSLAFVPPLVMAFGDVRSEAARNLHGTGWDGLLAGMLTTVVLGAVLRWTGRKAGTEFYRREGLVVVLVAWVLAAFLAAIPFRWDGLVPRWSDAVFESISGLTTTGATVFGSGGCCAIESVPRAILFWRSMTNWIGGIGIVVIFCALLPALGVRARTLIEMEVSGVQKQGSLPRVQDTMRQLVLLYASLSLVMVGSLRLLGLGWLDSVCASFGAVSTGGFYTKNASIGAHGLPGVEWAVAIFMIVGALNFGVLLAVARGDRGCLRNLVRDPELRLFVAMMVGATLVIAAFLWSRGGQHKDAITGVLHEYGSLEKCLRDSLFQVASIGGTCGFTTVDYSHWPVACQAILILLMGCGGCAGSTAGGVKIVRVVICVLLVRYAVRRFVRPASVEKIHLGDEIISDGQVSAVVSLVLAWVGLVGAGALVLLLDPRLDIVSAFSASLACMNSIGPALSAPGATIDVGPYGAFGALTGLSQYTLSFLMIVGRLEVFPVIAVLSRSFWR